MAVADLAAPREHDSPPSVSAPPHPCRPYFLPCLLAGTLSAVATLLTLFMAETLPRRRGRYQPVPAFEEREERAPPAAAVERQEGGHSWQLELQPSQPYKAAAAAALGAGGSPGSSSSSLGGSPAAAPAGSGGAKLQAFRGDSARALGPTVGTRGSSSSRARAKQALPGTGGGSSSSRARAKQALPGTGGGSSSSSSGAAAAAAGTVAAAAEMAGSESDSESLDFVVFGPADLERDLEAPQQAAPAGARGGRAGEPAAPAAACAAAGAGAGVAAAAAAGPGPPWYKQGLVLRTLAGYGLIAL